MGVLPGVCVRRYVYLHTRHLSERHAVYMRERRRVSKSVVFVVAGTRRLFKELVSERARLNFTFPVRNRRKEIERKIE